MFSISPLSHRWPQNFLLIILVFLTTGFHYVLFNCVIRPFLVFIGFNVYYTLSYFIDWCFYIFPLCACVVSLFYNLLRLFTNYYSFLKIGHTCLLCANKYYLLTYLLLNRIPFIQRLPRLRFKLSCWPWALYKLMRVCLYDNDAELVTFCVSHRLRKMYCGHARLYVCLSVRGRTPTLLHGPGCNLGAW